jgi:plasmid rolling circle replication initiator protein Rep
MNTLCTPVLTTMEFKTVTLSYRFADKWFEKEFKTNDPEWREALKVAVENGSAVKIYYDLK